METRDGRLILALVRHGRTDWNARKLMQGRTDRSLDAHGYADADRVAAALAVMDRRWDGVVTSPLLRAVQTGERIAAVLGAPLFPRVEDLQERGFGQAEGLGIDEARASYPDGEYPGAEPRDEATARGLRGLAEVADRYGDGGKALVVVSHGGLLRDLLTHLLGRRIPSLRNGDLSLIERTPEGGWDVQVAGGRPVDALEAELT